MVLIWQITDDSPNSLTFSPAKVSLHMVLDNNHKILIDYGKFHVTHDVTIFSLWMPVMSPQIKPLLVHRTVGVVLAYLNHHVCISFVVVFTLLVDLCPVAICLFVWNWLFIVAGYHYYHCLYDNQWWPAPR